MCRKRRGIRENTPGERTLCGIYARCSGYGIGRCVLLYFYAKIPRSVERLRSGRMLQRCLSVERLRIRIEMHLCQ